ncbi:MAG: ComF family protein [Clostridia bacterium]|nr:ComF family protein [Clostridia bacterium]
MVNGYIRKLICRAKDSFYPIRCIGCNARIPASSRDAFCPVCRARWEVYKHENCYHCGQPIDKCWCGVKRDTKGYINAEYHLVQYDKMADSIIKRMIYKTKIYNRERIFKAIAREMYNDLYPRVDHTDLVLCYVPRSPYNIYEYGYDQSEYISREFSKITGLNIADVLVNKGKRIQKRLSAEQRSDNAQRSYAVINGAGKLIKNKNVILIDDVLTTGASVTRCAQLLKLKGAKRVIVFALAKTI